MALYEIRTLITERRLSLVSYADFSSDLEAILAARTLVRRGETFEVWRGETLLYRIGPALEPSRHRLKTRAASGADRTEGALGGPVG